MPAIFGWSEDPEAMDEEPKPGQRRDPAALDGGPLPGQSGDAAPGGVGTGSGRSPEAGRAGLEGALRFRCPCCGSPLVLENLSVRVGEAAEPAVELVLETGGHGDLIEPIVHDLEFQLVRRSLREAGGVKARAAELLGLKYSTFWELVQRLGVDPGRAAAGSTPAGGSIADAAVIEVRVGDDPGPVLEIRVTPDPARGLLRSVVRETRRAVAHRALERADGNIARAAERVGMKYSTFHSLLARLASTGPTTSETS